MVSLGGAAGTGTGGGLSRGGASGTGAGGSTGGATTGGATTGGATTGGATTGGAATGGTGGVGCTVARECWIDGECRIDLEHADCPERYADVSPRPLVDATACAGRTREGFFYVEQDWAERICVYDADGALDGYRLSDDNDEHCGEHREFGHVAGTVPSELVVTDMDFFGLCYLSSFRFQSVSSTWNELFPEEVPDLEPCEPARDDCRSRVLLQVCRERHDGSSCTGCSDAAECRAEYPYFDPEAVTCERGICRVSPEPLGTCAEGEPAPECRTAAASYVCDFGTCSVCITHQECVLATGGARPICSEGTCVSASDAQKARAQSSTK
jgi:hypothetical protein